jgi:thiol-disulfide isomerase/thioredoxin
MADIKICTHYKYPKRIEVIMLYRNFYKIVMRPLWLASLLIFNSVSFSQSLVAGSAAPPLKPFKWIKGDPVTSFEKGKVYVIEFGATWCKPCIAMIPHLSSLTKEHPGEVNVISLFVMEENNEPLSAKEPVYVSGVQNFIDKRSDAGSGNDLASRCGKARNTLHIYC